MYSVGDIVEGDGKSIPSSRCSRGETTMARAMPLPSAVHEKMTRPVMLESRVAKLLPSVV